MAFFNKEFMDDRRREFLNSIGKIQYQTDGKIWNDGTVNSKEIIGTNIVILVDAPGSGKEDTITAVRAYDHYGRVAGQQPVTLKRKNINSGTIRLTISLEEEVENNV